MATSFQLYRGAKIGECLRLTLFELIDSGKITEEVANQILSQFDKSMYTALETKVTAKATIKGKLNTYRYIDNVWQFFLEPLILKLGSTGKGGAVSEVSIASAKLICVDSKMVLKEKEKEEGAEREINRHNTIGVPDGSSDEYIISEDYGEGNHHRYVQPDIKITPGGNHISGVALDSKPPF